MLKRKVKPETSGDMAATEAVQTLSAAANAAVLIVSAAAKEAVAALAQAAQAAKSTVAASAADAAKVLVVRQGDGESDHDQLLKLVEAVANMDRNFASNLSLVRSSISDVGNHMSTRMTALESGKLDKDDSYAKLYQAGVEKKIGELEKATTDLSTNMTKILAVGTVIVSLVGLGITVILHFWK